MTNANKAVVGIGLVLGASGAIAIAAVGLTQSPEPPTDSGVAYSGGGAAAREAPSSPKHRSPQEATAKAGSSPIPDDVVYGVADESTFHDIKRSLDVRINKRVSEETLRAIAHELKGTDSKTYERTFIVYYLPDMEVNAGGWATTHFNPRLEVKVLGLTAAAHERMISKSDSPNGEVIGRWIEKGPLGGKITIYERDGQLYMDKEYNDGSMEKKELIEQPSSRGRRLRAQDEAQQDYFLINGRGDLELRDSQGVISTARQIE